MAINDVLPLKAPRRYAIANAKWLLGLWDANDLISMVSFTFAMRRHLIRLSSAPFTSFRLTQFGLVPFADLHVQRQATKQNTEFTEGAQKLKSYFSPFVNRKFVKCWNDVSDPSYFSRPLPIVYVMFRLEDSRH